MGIIFSIIAALFFGLYTLPKKVSHLQAYVYAIFMALGFSISSIIAYLIYLSFGNNFDLFNFNLIYAILAGFLWGLAFMLLISAIERIGIVRSNQWKNLQGPIGVGLNLLILGEASKVNPFLALTAGFLIFISAIFFNLKSNTQSKPNDAGVFYAISSGVLFGIVSLINNYVTKVAGIYNQQVFCSISILITLLLIGFKSNLIDLKNLGTKKELIIAGLSGVLYFGASVFMLLAFQNIESSIAFNIIQLNFIVVVVAGIIFFKEYNIKTHWKTILLGIISATAGVIILSFARG